MNWQQILRKWLPFLFYYRCSFCQRKSAQPLCRHCLPQVKTCQLSASVYPHFWSAHPPVFPWGRYGGALKQIISDLKYKNQPQLARPLGEWLGEAWLQYHGQQTSKGFFSPLSSAAVIVVPIPMHREKLRTRGFNQAELIARSFCRITNLPLHAHGLERVRHTTAQHSLSKQQRQENLNAAFCLGKDLLRQRPKRPILLIDDIYTTGATARSAIATLSQAGFQVYGIATAAITERGGGAGLPFS